MSGRDYVRICVTLLGLWATCAVLGTAAFWTSLAMGTMQMRGDTSLAGLFRLQGVPWLATAILTPAVVAWSMRLAPVRGSWPMAVAGHAAGVTVFGVSQTTLIIALHMLFAGRAYAFGVESVFGRLASSAVLILTTYACMVGATGAWAAIQRAASARRTADQLARSRAELERDLASVRLMVLRQQLQPHFLFNALNAVAGLIEEDAPRARRLLASLGDLLRLALQRSEAAEATLGEELDFADRFLAVERERLGERLRVDYAIGGDLLGVRVPSFAVQPLVENAIRHGIARLEYGGVVTIDASRRGQAICVTVTNDVDAGAPSGAEAGGLGGLRARLAGMYGGRAVLETSVRDGRFHAVMSVPLEAD
jgi:hypothetical protein